MPRGIGLLLLVEKSDLSPTCPVVVQSLKAGQTPVIAFVTVVLSHIMTCSQCKYKKSEAPFLIQKKIFIEIKKRTYLLNLFQATTYLRAYFFFFFLNRFFIFLPAFVASLAAFFAAFFVSLAAF